MPNEAITGAPVLEVRDIRKHFGAVTALDDVSLELGMSEIVGLVGDNGAGKSTLLKIMSGVYTPDAGEVVLDGTSVKFGTPGDARAKGIEAVYQELALVDDMDVAENMFLGRELLVSGIGGKLGVLNLRAMRRQAEETIRKMHIRIPGLAEARVRNMSGGQRQGAALARSIHWGRKVLLLDEPTAALGVEERGEAERIIEGLRERGLPMLLIAHDLPMIFRLSDRIVVLRHGGVVANLKIERTSPEEVVAYITGAKISDPK